MAEVVVAGALLGLLTWARQNGYGNEPAVRKMLAMQAKYDKLPDKRKKEAKDLQKKIQGMKDNFGVGKKMFDMVTGTEYDTLMSMLDKLS